MNGPYQYLSLLKVIFSRRSIFYKLYLEIIYDNKKHQKSTLTNSEIDTTDITARIDSDADTGSSGSSSDHTNTNISTNSEDELCGIEALTTICKQNRRHVMMSHLNINSLSDNFLHIEDALINEL